MPSFLLHFEGVSCSTSFQDGRCTEAEDLLAWTVTSLSSSHLVPGGASASLQDGLLLCTFLSFSLADCPVMDGALR